MSPATSTMLPLGTPAPMFRLRDTDGHLISLQDLYEAPMLLIAVLCNHCPFVKHINADLIEFAKEYIPRGVAIVAINANDAEIEPQDSYERMKDQMIRQPYPFPYLYDETQEAVKELRAVCTPEFYLFDDTRRLVYRGQFDDSRPSNGDAISGKSLRDACDAMFADGEVDPDQKPSIGCGIKWKGGVAPDYTVPIHVVAGALLNEAAQHEAVRAAVNS